jgi:hypothetical protein
VIIIIIIIIIIIVIAIVINVKGKKENLSLCLTNNVLPHEGVWGNGYIDPYFLDVGTSWR